jgi:hypothetical protein
MEIGKFNAERGNVNAELQLSEGKEYIANFKFCTKDEKFDVSYNYEFKELTDIWNRINKVGKGIEDMLEEDPNCKSIAFSTDVYGCIENLKRQAIEKYNQFLKGRNKRMIDREY